MLCFHVDGGQVLDSVLHPERSNIVRHNRTLHHDDSRLPRKSGYRRSSSHPEFLKSVEHYARSVHLVLMSCHERYDCFRNLLAAN